MSVIIKDINNIVQLENYSSKDTSLIVSKSFGRSFGSTGDYVEFHVYSPNNILISSDYNFKGYSIPGTQGTTTTSVLTFSPDVDLENLGYAVGTFNVQYNILRNRIQPEATPTFFISEISADRTELRVFTNILSDSQVESSSIQFITDIQQSSYFKDFLLDFGSNQFCIGVNMALDKNTSPFSLLIKLYQPLPTNFDINSSFWIVEELSDPYSYSVQLIPDPVTGSSLTLGPPNFDLNLDHRQIRSSDYVNYQELLSNSDPNVYHLILNKLNQNNVVLNIDYSDFSNFVHFSSAKQRLLNFYFKVQQIENFNAQINIISGSFITPSVSSSINALQTNITNIIDKFDGYDHYLYFSSESNAWPKSNSTPPYILYSSTSSQVTNWLGSDDSFSPLYGGQLYSSSFYDSENIDNFVYTIPEYIRIDPANRSYELFIMMIGQHFDYIWTYIKAFGDIYKTNNSLNKGISKDLVFYMLNSFGIKLYNNISNQDLYQYLLGVTNSGSYTYPTSSFETLITSSATTTSGQDNVKEIFKRIYHNVPYLLKTKGTEESLRTLSSVFGVPSTIMRFNEYGGMDKQCDTIQYSYDRFSYALNTDGTGSVVVDWDELNLNNFTSHQASFADTIEFRFKPNVIFNNTQSLFVIGDGISSPNIELNIYYSSSNGIPYGNINFLLNGSGSYATSDTISLPIFYTGSIEEIPWWNVMVRRRNPSFALENDLIDFDIQFIVDSGSNMINVGQFDSTGSGDQYYDVFVKNNINGRIGHQGSSSLFVSQSFSASYNTSWDTSAEFYLGGYPDGSTFNGLFQELRFWNVSLFQSKFNYHVLNPESIEGIDSGSFYNNLAGYFPLGNDLFTYDHVQASSVQSVHPNQNAIFPSASFVGFNDHNNYIPQEEIYYAHVPNAGYLSQITDKIRIQDVNISGSVLSPYIRLEEPLEFPLTKDIHLIDASFSPQNEIDDDIIASLGSTFNIDNYIGDPHEEHSNYYSNLKDIQNIYFQRYISKYNYKDYIRLIKYFDNALFKMFEDFIAVRADLQTGITIRPTLLERSKVKRFSPELITINNFTASIGHAKIEDSNDYKSGYGDGSDFYTGELSGSIINVDEYFEENNHNPYTGDKGVLALFKGSDYDVLLNNVQKNILSSIRKKIDENGTLLVNTELQDSYYTYKRHILPRYLGSKATSQQYNFFTPGDDSYGNTAAIDINSLKFAWIKSIASSSINFYDKTSVILKYLVDQSGSLTELSRHNFNVFEVQNTFKSGDPVIVSLSDLIHPSNQTTLDGNKIIFEGGFSYWPIVYRETGEQLHFRYLDSLTSTASISLTATQTNIFQFNTKNINLNPDSIKNIDDDVSDGVFTLTYGNQSLSAGTFAFPHIFPFSSWSYADVSILKEVGSVTFTSASETGPFGVIPPFTQTINADTDQFVYPINNTFFNLSDIVTSNDSFSKYIKLNDGSYAYQVPRTSIYNFKVDIPFNVSINENNEGGGTILKVVAVIEKNSGSNANSSTWQYLDSSGFSHVEASNVARYCWDSARSLIFLDFDSWRGGSTDFPIKVLCSCNSNIALNANDFVRVNFFIIRLRDFLPDPNVGYAKLSFANRFGSLSQNVQAGTMTITDTINDTIVLTTDGLITDNTLFTVTGSDNNIIKFSDSASLLYGKIIFDQVAISSSTANLYSPIDFPFVFEEGDIVRFNSYFTSNPVLYRVDEVIAPVTSSDGTTVFNDLELVLDKPVSNVEDISANFVIFRRLADETSVILNFKKNLGETSQALLIPFDLDLDVKSEVANITTEISQNIAGLNQ